MNERVRVMNLTNALDEIVEHLERALSLAARYDWPEIEERLGFGQEAIEAARDKLKARAA